MNNQPENVKTTVSIPPKSNDLFRKQAFKDRITMSELFIEYQKAYLKELEREKDNKRLIKELKEKDLVRITVAISTKAGEKLKLQTEQ